MGHSQNSLTREEQLRIAREQREDSPNGRDSRTIQRDIDRTRHAMDETLDELGERLHPRKVLDDVIDLFRSPQARDVSRRAAEGAGDFTASFGRQVRDNPVGVTLIGAGLAWLAFGNRREDRYMGSDQDARRRRYRDDYDADFDSEEPEFYSEEDLLLEQPNGTRDDGSSIVIPESYGNEQDEDLSNWAGADSQAAASNDRTQHSTESAWQSTKQNAASTGQAVSNAASSVGESVGDAARATVGSVKSAASAATGAVSSAGRSTRSATRQAYRRGRETGRDVYREATDYGRRARHSARKSSRSSNERLAAGIESASDRVHHAHQESPLALGLGVMALGALVGTLLPRTRQEDEVMGDYSDNAIDRVKQSGQQVAANVKQRVEHVGEVAKASAVAKGLNGDDLSRRASDAVAEASSSIAEAARNEGLHPTQLKQDMQDVAKDAKSQAEAEKRDAEGELAEHVERVDPDATKVV